MEQEQNMSNKSNYKDIVIKFNEIEYTNIVEQKEFIERVFTVKDYNFRNNIVKDILEIVQERQNSELEMFINSKINDTNLSSEEETKTNFYLSDVQDLAIQNRDISEKKPIEDRIKDIKQELVDLISENKIPEALKLVRDVHFFERDQDISLDEIPLYLDTRHEYSVYTEVCFLGDQETYNAEIFIYKCQLLGFVD